MVSSPDFANSLTVDERRVGALHARGDDGRRARRHAARAALPGLDVPRLPAPPRGASRAGDRAAPQPEPCARSTRASSAAPGRSASLLGVDVGARASATALLVLVQATLFARIVARAFDGASLRAVATRRSSLLALAFAGARRARVGLRGRGRARRVDASSPSCGSRSSQRRLRNAARGARRRRERRRSPRPRAGRRRARGVLRPLPPAARARLRRPGRGARRGSRRSTSRRRSSCSRRCRSCRSSCG